MHTVLSINEYNAIQKDFNKYLKHKKNVQNFDKTEFYRTFV